MDTQFFIACETGCRVLCLDVAGRPISNISMPLPASGLALSPDHSTLFVTCAGPESKVCVVDTRRLKIIRTFPAGHKAGAPVLSPDGRTLYVCDQFDDDVTVIDLTGSSGRGPHAVVGHDVRSASPGAPSIARPARQEVGDFASSGGQESSVFGCDVRSASGVADDQADPRLLTSSPTNVSSGQAMRRSGGGVGGGWRCRARRECFGYGCREPKPTTPYVVAYKRNPGPTTPYVVAYKHQIHSARETDANGCSAPGGLLFPRWESLPARLAELCELPSGRRAGGWVQLGSAERWYWRRRCGRC